MLRHLQLALTQTADCLHHVQAVGGMSCLGSCVKVLHVQDLPVHMLCCPTGNTQLKGCIGLAHAVSASYLRLMQQAWPLQAAT